MLERILTDDMTRKRFIHWFACFLMRLLRAIEFEMPFSDWRNSLYEWMEREGACCTRHGFERDFKEGETGK